MFFLMHTNNFAYFIHAFLQTVFLYKSVNKQIKILSFPQKKLKSKHNFLGLETSK